ncbi:MAG: hypothetical protein ACFE8C_11045 [Promethearchaeota archaeon]
MSFTELLELTPSKLDWLSTLENFRLYASIVFYGWNTGVYGWFGYPSITGPSLADHHSLADRPRSAGSQFSYINEDVSSLLSRNRILMISGRDFSEDTDLGNFWCHNSINFYCSCLGPVDGLQFLISFDLATYRTNEVQLFVFSEYIDNFIITNRKKVSVLAEPEIPGLDRFSINLHLRPVKLHQELYFYSVKVSALI